jgi:hypothetical protein
MARRYLIFSGLNAKRNAQAVIDLINTKMAPQWVATRTKKWADLEKDASLSNADGTAFCIPVDDRILVHLTAAQISSLQSFAAARAAGLKIVRPSPGGPPLVDQSVPDLERSKKLTKITIGIALGVAAAAGALFYFFA